MAVPAEANRVTAAHHNRVLAAGTRRAVALEPQLVDVVAPILDRAARQAAKAFKKKATRVVTASARTVTITAAGEAISDQERQLQSAFSFVDAAQRELAQAIHDGDPETIKRAEKKLASAQRRLERTLSGFKKPVETPPDVVTAKPVETPAPVPASPAEVTSEIARSAARAEAEAEGSSVIESILAGRPGEAIRRAREALTKPFGGGADWVAPLADEVVNVALLVAQIKEAIDPVREAVVTNMIQTAVDGAGVAFDITNPFAQKVLAQSASQVTNIAATTQLNVMRTIKESYEAGLSIPDTAKAIQVGMQEANLARATLIARTELVGAVNGGSLAATQIVQSATGETYYKQWLTAPGAPNPRHEDYEGLDEQTQQLDDPFDVDGNALQFPGDPDGPPEEVCNCRCALVYISAEEAAEQDVDLGGTSSPPPEATPEEAHGVLRLPSFEDEEGILLPKPLLEPADGRPLPDMRVSTRVDEGRWVAGDDGVNQFIGPGAVYTEKTLTDFLESLPMGKSDLGFAVTVDKTAERLTMTSYLPSARHEITTAFSGPADASLGLKRLLDYENEGRGELKVGTKYPTTGAGVQLSNTEVGVLRQWTEGSYDDTNATLRLGEKLSPQNQVEVARLDRILDQAPVLEGDPLYRGFNLKTRELPKVGDTVNVGLGGYASTTSDVARASRFGDTLFRIEGPVQAFPAEGFSYLPSEHEYIIPRSQQFEVTKIGKETVAAADWEKGTREVTVLDVRAIPRPGMPVGTKIFTADPQVAANAIAEGKAVVLTQPTEITTLIDDLGKISADAQQAGEVAPRLDLGQVSVPGTNLFAQESIGVPRVVMPQLKGVPVPGSLADKMVRDSRGEVDIAPLFYKHLQDSGTQIEFGVDKQVDNLRATQTELDGAKVAGIMDYLEGGGVIEGSIPVTPDGYVIDGHHRWAAVTGLDYKTNADKPWMIQTDVIHKPVTEILSEANVFAAEYGIPPGAAYKAAVTTTKAETEIGITPFRPEDSPIGFYDSMKAKQFEAELEPVAKQYGVTITHKEQTPGMWEGNPDPSYRLLAHDGTEGVEQFAATMRAKYDQDAVALFSPDPNGESYEFTLHKVDSAQVFEKMGDFGIPGATGVGDTVRIFGERELAENVEKLASSLDSVVTVRRGATTWIERGDPARSLPEIHALNPAVDFSVYERDHGIMLSMIRVPTDLQGKGLASKAMDDLIRYADSRALPIALTPEAVGGGMSVTQLRQWYRRLGFVPNKGRTADLRFTESMIRKPVTPAQPLFAPDLYSDKINEQLKESQRLIWRLDRAIKAGKTDQDYVALRAATTKVRKDLLGLRAHPDPRVELTAARNEILSIEGKTKPGAAMTATNRARLEQLQRKVDLLEGLINSGAYKALRSERLAVEDAAHQSAIEAQRAAKLSGSEKAMLRSSDLDTITDALREKLDGEWVAIPPRTIHWSTEGDYNAGPSIAWKQDGVIVTKELHPSGLSDAAKELAAQAGWDDLAGILPGLPPIIRDRVRNVNIYNGSNPDDAYWRRVYNEQFGHSVAASADGVVNFFRQQEGTVKQSTFEHEVGHLLYGGGPRILEDWIAASTSDAKRAVKTYDLPEGTGLQGLTPGSDRGFIVGYRGVTDYGGADPSEDFAESIRLYLRDRREGSIGTLLTHEPVRFADVYPARAKLIEKWLPMEPIETTTPDYLPLLAEPKIPEGVLSAPDVTAELAESDMPEDHLHHQWWLEQQEADALLTKGLGKDVGVPGLQRADDPYGVFGSEAAARRAKKEVAGKLSERLAGNATWDANVKLPVIRRAIDLNPDDVFRDHFGGGTYRVRSIDPQDTVRISGWQTVPHGARLLNVEVVSPDPAGYGRNIGANMSFTLKNDHPVQVLVGEKYPLPVHGDLGFDLYGLGDEVPDAKRVDLHRRSTVGGLVDGWSATAADNNAWALAMQRAVAEEFKQGAAPLKVFVGRDAGAIRDSKAIYEEKGAALRAFVRAQYEETQRQLREQGITEVTLYRGMGGARGAAGVTQEEMVLQPASSFASDYDTARLFTGSNPALIAVKVPADRILATPRSGWGSLREHEFVVLAPQEGQAVDKAIVMRQRDSFRFPRDTESFFNAAKDTFTEFGTGGSKWKFTETAVTPKVGQHFAVAIPEYEGIEQGHKPVFEKLGEPAGGEFGAKVVDADGATIYSPGADLYSKLESGDIIYIKETTPLQQATLVPVAPKEGAWHLGTPIQLPKPGEDIALNLGDNFLIANPYKSGVKDGLPILKKVGVGPDGELIGEVVDPDGATNFQDDDKGVPLKVGDIVVAQADSKVKVAKWVEK